MGKLGVERAVAATLADGSPFGGRGLVNPSVVVPGGVAVTLLEIVRTGD